MKLFKAFTSGKNILLYDQPKLLKYLNLCSATPISYNGIKSCVGYKEIISTQFNYIKFNTALYPKFNELILRDLNQLDQMEFNSYLQTIKNYLVYSNEVKSFEIQFFKEIIDKIVNQGTFIQKGNFYLHFMEYFSLGSNLNQLSSVIDNLYEELLAFKTQNLEEEMWKHIIRKVKLDQLDKMGLSKLDEKDYKFLDQFIENIELLLINQNSFENLSTNLEILRLTTIFEKAAGKDLGEKKYQALIILLKQCQKEIDLKVNCLNTFQLSSYIYMVGRNQNLLTNMSWDLLRNELITRNLDEMPLQEVLALLIFFYQHNQINDQFANSVIRHLYQNINLITPLYVAKCFEISAAIDSNYSQKFIAKLEKKVNPKILSLEDVSTILVVLVEQGNFTQQSFEKLFQSVTNRLHLINVENLYGILYALNHFKIQNKDLMNRIFTLQFKDDEAIKSQLQILQYLQLHDPKNPRVVKIQKNFLSVVQKNFDNQLLNQFLQILVNVNEKTQKTIKLLSELKPPLIKYLNEIEQDQDEGEITSDVKQFLELQYDLK